MLGVQPAVVALCLPEGAQHAGRFEEKARVCALVNAAPRSAAPQPAALPSKVMQRVPSAQEVLRFVLWAHRPPLPAAYRLGRREKGTDLLARQDCDLSLVARCPERLAAISTEPEETTGIWQAATSETCPVGVVVAIVHGLAERR